MNSKVKVKVKSYNQYIAYVQLIILSTVYVYFILKNSNWTWGDDFGFLKSTARGKLLFAFNNDLGCLNNMGRFFPLGQFEYNLLLLTPFYKSPYAHYSLVAISFLIFVTLSYKLYNTILKETNWNRTSNIWIIFITIVFLLFYFHKIFFFLVYPERTIVILLTAFFLLYDKFIKSDSLIYAIGAFLISLYSCFCKETLFIIYAILIVTNAIFNRNNMSLRQWYFNYALTLNIIIFLLLYYFIAYRNAIAFYSKNSNYHDLFFFSIGNLKLIFGGLLLAIWRIYDLILRKNQNAVLLDSMLFAGIFYAFANIALKLPMDYYYFPAVTLIMPSIIYWSTKYIQPKWIFISLFIVSIYYWRKFPDIIQNIQGQRLETSKDINKLISYIHASKEILWVENPQNDMISKEEIGYEKDITKIYLDFYDPTIVKLNLKKTLTLSNSIKPGTILFYSDVNKGQQNNLFSIGLKKLNLPNIYAISIYYQP